MNSPKKQHALEQESFDKGFMWGVATFRHMARNLEWAEDYEYVNVFNRFLQLFHEDHEEDEYYKEIYIKTESDADFFVNKMMLDRCPTCSEGHGDEE